MIRRILVKGLFDLYDYDIPFLENPTVKVLIGPNGYGKTTLLKVVDNLYKGNFWFFHFLDFQSLAIELSEPKANFTVVIEKRIVTKVEAIGEAEAGHDENLLDDTDAGVYEETVTLTDGQGAVIEQFIIRDDYIQYLLAEVRRKGVYRDIPTTREEELLEVFYDSREDEYIQNHCKNISLALQEYDTRYLPAQRVFNRDQGRQPMRPVRNHTYEIDHVNAQIGWLYRRTQNEFAAKSQQIDATFINRLVQRENSYSRDELREKLDMLKNRIGNFKDLNLFSDMELMDYSMDDMQSYNDLKKVLSQYVDDMNDKMDRFDELYQKMSLYKRVVTNKVLSEKAVDFSEKGLTVKNVKGRILSDLHKLSSGEQNLLILYYNLIFKSNGKTVLLIDEPENSLHVAWQSKMLDDYISMSKTTGCQIVLATHSPTFVDGRWELTTDLFRQFKGKD